MRRWKTALGAALTLGLYACGIIPEFGGVGDQAFDYNIAVDQANNKELLLNLIRAGHGLSPEWTSISLVTGQRTPSAQLGLADTLGPRGTNPANVLTSLGAVSGFSNSQINVLDVREFYQYYLTELKPSELARY